MTFYSKVITDFLNYEDTEENYSIPAAIYSYMNKDQTTDLNFYLDLDIFLKKRTSKFRTQQNKQMTLLLDYVDIFFDLIFKENEWSWSKIVKFFYTLLFVDKLASMYLSSNYYDSFKDQISFRIGERLSKLNKIEETQWKCLPLLSTFEDMQEPLKNSTFSAPSFFLGAATIITLKFLFA